MKRNISLRFMDVLERLKEPSPPQKKTADLIWLTPSSVWIESIHFSLRNVGINTHAYTLSSNTQTAHSNRINSLLCELPTHTYTHVRMTSFLQRQINYLFSNKYPFQFTPSKTKILYHLIQLLLKSQLCLLVFLFEFCLDLNPTFFFSLFH